MVLKYKKKIGKKLKKGHKDKPLRKHLFKTQPMHLMAKSDFCLTNLFSIPESDKHMGFMKFSGKSIKKNQISM